MKLYSLMMALFFALMPFISHAQFPEGDGPVGQASLVSEYDAISDAGEPFWLALEINMPEDWHIYWRNPGDSGIPPTVKLELPEGFTQGPLHWPSPEVIEYGFLTNFGYSGPAHVLIPITPPPAFSAEEYEFSGVSEWLICKEICIPESDEFSLTLPVSDAPKEAENASLHRAIAALPAPWKGEVNLVKTEDAYVLSLETGDMALPEAIDSVALFAYESGVFSHAITDQTFEYGDDILHVSVPHGSLAPTQTIKGTLLVTHQGQAAYYAYHAESDKLAAQPADRSDSSKEEAPQEPEANDVTAENESSDVSFGLLLAMVLAFGGGLILNLMPCVLPVLSLKALSLAKLQDEDKSAIRTQALTYTAGILVTFISFAIVLMMFKNAGMSVGWGFQLQDPAFVLVLLYIVFSVGLNLSGMFEVPSGFANVGGGLASGHSARASFFTGVLATLVATPCTAPFMAGALGYAVTQPPVTMLLVFISLGLGLAAPYLLVSFVPFFRHVLPKPGAWMDGFKQFLAFPMYATAAWLLWVLTIQAGDLGMIWALAGLIAIVYLAWVYMRGFGKVTKIITLIIVVGVLGHSIKAQESVPFGVMKYMADKSVPHVNFSEDKLAELRAKGTPVFVDATAAWCITCKVNERTSIKVKSVQKAFAEKGITMMIADWTNRNEPIRQYLERFGRNGVPLYVYYAPGKSGVLLPQILTPEIVLNAIGAKRDENDEDSE